MSISVEGIYLSLDFTRLITEKTANTLFIDLDKWIAPFGYFDQGNKSVICNEFLPDGCYIVLGKVSYPGKKRMSYHEVYQFTLVKSQGKDLLMSRPLNNYPELPPEVPLSPKFPMFQVGPTSDLRKGQKVLKELTQSYLTIDMLQGKVNQYPIDTIEGKIYRLRLALERFIRKEI